MTEPDTFEQLRAALADRYAVERPLGQGGMATVYLARDLKHDRPVAIKVLRPELAASLGSERFLQEIRIAAGLSHPNLLPVHDSGEVAGKLYYVMPFVEGESLADRLRREGPMEPGEAVRLAVEVADALHVAHQRGIIHRDIKPANILIQHGHALVADFGIARAVDAAGNTSGAVTATGFAIGTPTYMSPEQALGEPVDPRTDVYALGVVLYEMLSGKPPFAGETPQAVMASRFTSAPVPLASVRAVPRDLADAVDTALAPKAHDRFPTTEAFAAALRAADLGGPVRRRRAPRRGLVAGIALVALVGIVASVMVGRGSGPAAVPGVVVLPFENLGPPSEQYFADGLTEEITSRLGSISGLRVISRTTALAYAGAGHTVSDIGKALDVGWVLEGTVRSDGQGDSVRISPQLVRVGDETQVWSDRMTVPLAPGDVFAMQARIAERVAQALDVTVLATEQAVVRASPTTSAAAHDAYLRGRYHWVRRTPADLREAAREFQSALAADSGFAEAWAGLADAFALYPFYRLEDLPADTAYARAERAARRALALDSTLAAAHASLGYVRMYAAHDWDESLAQLRRAVQLDPGYATAQYWLGERLAADGLLDSAVAHTAEAARLDPTSPAAVGLHGVYLSAVGRYDEAEQALTAALRIAPGFAQAALVLALQYQFTGDTARADEIYAQAGLSPALRAALLRNDTAAVRTHLPRGLPQGLDDRMIDALLYAVVGDREATLDALEAAQRQHSQYLFGLRGHAVLRPYLDEPRVQAVLARVGL